MNLHPRIAADTLPVCITPDAHVRLMNDNRWPWLLLIPLQEHIEELHDLTHEQRDRFMADVNQVSRVLQRFTQCKSVNVAMLGNVVSQLHCHVVARDDNDPNWPGTVWGFGTAVPYEPGQADELLATVRKSFK
ncbi:HIT family protein [Granulosicoccus sp. 3-233]|uniref:HIT family protein n=1 Tax=Granulosicoccus sp. 3-233 TaxID=3417969 RepID=UPI003D358D34